MIHIGHLIRRELIRQHHSVTWFAEQMACSRTSVYKIFDNPAISTDTLVRICKVLNVDFFKMYSDKLD